MTWKLMEAAARKQAGLPDNWLICAADCTKDTVPAGFTKVRGMVSQGVFKSGPRRGRPNWKPVAGTERTLFVSDVEIEAAATAYERVTGKCRTCEGAGKTVSGFGAGENTYRECRDCGGRGTPKGTT